MDMLMTEKHCEVTATGEELIAKIVYGIMPPSSVELAIGSKGESKPVVKHYGAHDKLLETAMEVVYVMKIIQEEMGG